MKTDKLVEQILNNHINNDGEITEEGIDIIDMEIQNYFCEIVSTNSYEYLQLTSKYTDKVLEEVRHFTFTGCRNHEGNL